MNLEAWLERLRCGGNIEKQQFFKKKFLERLQTSAVAIETEKANEQHYEVPTEFFQTVCKLIISKNLFFIAFTIFTVNCSSDVVLINDTLNSCKADLKEFQI
jgi:hypothetical protein